MKWVSVTVRVVPPKEETCANGKKQVALTAAEPREPEAVVVAALPRQTAYFCPTTGPIRCQTDRSWSLGRPSHKGHNPLITTMAERDELVLDGAGAPTEAPAVAAAAAAAAAARTELSVEEIIEEHVGALGWAQLIHVFLVSIAWVFDAQSTLVTIFADGQPPWTCKGAAGGGGGACPSSMCGLDAGAWEWTRGRKSSTVAEWGLVCDRKFRAGIPASVFFLGSLLGSAFHGRLADNHLGRKKTILLSCVLSSLTCFLTSLSPNVWVYALLRFSNGFARSGIGICCLVLSTEVVGRKWRGQVGQYGFFFFTVGFLTVPLVAYPSRTSWRTMYRVLSVLPLAYSILVLPFVSESPRWLVLRGRTKEAMDILHKLARINGRSLPADLTISNPVSPAAAGGGGGGKSESLWSARWAVKRMVLTMATGFGVGFVYYGVQLNVENLNFNRYLSVAVNGLMEIPAVVLGSVLLSFMSRRALFSSSAALAGAACLLCIPFATGGAARKGRSSWAQLVAEAVGFMAVSTAFDVLYVYCVELFPTNVRNFAVSMLRQALMLGAAVAPQLVVLGRVSPKLSFVVFGCFALFSAALTVWLPETRDAPLYETMEQQESEEMRKLQGGAAGRPDQVELPVQEHAV